MNRPLSRLYMLTVGALLCAIFSSNSFALRVLVFSKVADDAYRHASIPDGIKAIHEIGAEKGWQVDDTVDAGTFNAATLSQYDVIVWNNTGGDVLTSDERTSFENFIHHGGGYAGIHEAAPWSGAKDVDWPWYERLVGAHFKGHPAGTAMGKVLVASERHPAIEGLPNPWTRQDEWYDWVQDPSRNPALHILLYVYENSYGGGEGIHPLAWWQKFEGGRMFYTALGHTEASYSEANFRRHLAGGIEWAAAQSPNLVSAPKGENQAPKSTSPKLLLGAISWAGGRH